MKHTPPPLIFPALAVLSIRKTEKLSDGVTAVSGTEGVSHVSDRQRMLQSLMSRWKLVLALRSSILFSKDWTYLYILNCLFCILCLCYFAYCPFCIFVHYFSYYLCPVLSLSFCHTVELLSLKQIPRMCKQTWQ